jgi:hypothetical protein
MPLIDRLRGFLFGPIDARTVGGMRISLGLILLASHLLWLPDLVTLFSDAGPVSTEAVAEATSLLRWSYLDHRSDASILLGLHLLGVVPLVGMIVGFRSRTMVLLVLIVQVAIHHRAPWTQHGGDRVLRLATLSLLLVPCGAGWSVDAWLQRRRQSAESSPLVPLIAHRVIQAQWMIIYFVTGLEKVVGGSWQRGDALYYALSLRTFQRFPSLTEALLSSVVVQELLRVATWATLGWELAFPLLVVWRRTRGPALVVGIAIHAGIALTMMVGTFSYAMVWGYLAFLGPGWAAALALRAGRAGRWSGAGAAAAR